MSVQAFLARTIMSLPSGVIQAMAGKKAVVGDETLDPRIALMARQAAAQPAITTLPVTVARQGTQAAIALSAGKRRASVAIRDLKVPGGDGVQLDARLYTPVGATGSEPLLVYFHQGGCVLGGIWMSDTWCSILADDARAVVLSVDYRHAPEHRFPAAVDDAISAYAWAVENAKTLGSDGKRIGVGGDSAGGYLSAVVCVARKKAGQPQPQFQLLIYPCTDWTSVGGTMTTMANAYPLSQPMMEWFAGHYLAPDQDRTDWRISPALEKDQTGLAPALVYTAAFDPLTSQVARYADALMQAGVPVVYRHYKSLSHAFTVMSGVVPMARKALTEIAADVKKAFG
ncbi:MAG TPA: alpha/beta hydrolase [Hyphomonadaceae bacterium]|nr:alpha/beta hydrolase [Hyphomonadaceae bacterium]